MEGTYLKPDGERVREGRERMALSIEDMSTKARVSPHTWLRAEHGEEIRPSSARRIAAALGVEPEQLRGPVVGPLAEAPSPPPEVSEKGRLVEERSLVFVDQLENWVRLSDAAQKLNLSHNQTISLVESGEVRAVETCYGWLVDDKELQRYAEDKGPIKPPWRRDE